MPYKKLLILIINTAIFISILFLIEPPKSWPEASTSQILLFFIPLLLTLSTFFDFFLKYPPHSFIAGLGIMVLVAFAGVNQLSPITTTLIVLTTILFIRLFPKVRLPRLKLTRFQKIPKMTPNR